MFSLTHPIKWQHTENKLLKYVLQKVMQADKRYSYNQILFPVLIQQSVHCYLFMSTGAHIIFCEPLQGIKAVVNWRGMCE